MNEDLRQLIAISEYRLQQNILHCSDAFWTFDAGKGGRTPGEIIQHLKDVTDYGKLILHISQECTEKAGVAYVQKNFIILKNYLEEAIISSKMKKELINGPLSDALTHIGQLALLRRLAHDPIVWEDYTKAAVKL